jgi:imidazole glycerol-phosphate synthase subunit HisF
MTVSVRVIPCLDVADGRVVKGVQFQNLRDAGDPVELAAAYDAAGADEITFLDVTASSDGRATMLDVVRRTAESVFIPLTVGGGIRSVDDVDALLRAGADKVAVNTAALARPELIKEIAERFGRQVLVLSVDARRDPSAGTTSGFVVTTHGGRRIAMVSDVAGGHTAVAGTAGARVSRGIAVDAVAWARLGAELGAGEILLNAMDTDGTRTGFDLELIAAVRAVVSIPLIASGGAGTVEDFLPAVEAGADAVLAASVFHFGEIAIAEVKHSLGGAGVPVR